MKVVIDELADGTVNLSQRDIEECEVQTSPVTDLYLDGNRLASFVFGDGAFPNLKVLDLSRNLLTSFDIGDRAFPNLEILYLDSNRLTSFVVGYGAFPNLKGLFLYDNLLTSFVGGNSFPNLENLYLSYNPIQILNLCRCQVPRLNEVWVKGTMIKFVDPTIIKSVKGKKVGSHVRV